MANELTGDLISKWIGFKLYPDSLDEPFFSESVMLQCVPSAYLCPGSDQVQEFLRNFFTQSGSEFMNEITSSKMDIQDNMLIEDLKLNITSLVNTLPWLCPQHLAYIDLKDKKLTFETSMSVQFMDDLLVKIKLDWDAEEVEYQIKEYDIKPTSETAPQSSDVDVILPASSNAEKSDNQDKTSEAVEEKANKTEVGSETQGSDLKDGFTNGIEKNNTTEKSDVQEISEPVVEKDNVEVQEISEPIVEKVEAEVQEIPKPVVEKVEDGAKEIPKSDVEGADTKNAEVFKEDAEAKTQIKEHEIPEQNAPSIQEQPEEVNADSRVATESVATDTDTENTLHNAQDQLELVGENENRSVELADSGKIKSSHVTSSESTPKLIAGNGAPFTEEPEFIKVKKSLKPTPPISTKSKPLPTTASKANIPAKPSAASKKVTPVKTNDSLKTKTPVKVKSASDIQVKATRTNSKPTDVKVKPSAPRILNRSSSTLISNRNSKPTTASGRSVPSTPRPASTQGRSTSTSSSRFSSTSTHFNSEPSNLRYDPKRFSSQLDFTYPSVSTTPVRNKPEVQLRQAPERVIPTRKEIAAKHHSTSFSIGHDNSTPVSDPKPSEMPAWSKELRPYLSKGKTGIRF